MAEASIRARIAADASGFHAALKNTEDAAKAWGLRMAKTTSGVGMGKGMGGSMALLEFSRAAEDAQYGIRGVLNNIPGLAMALGGGAGLAGVASLAAVSVATLGKQIYDFVTNAKAIKEATDEVGRLDQKLKEASARGAKEALEGTAEGARQLKDSIAEANFAFTDGNEKLAANVALTKDATDATVELEKAKIAAADIPESEKILKTLELERAAMVEAQAAEERRLKASLTLHEERTDAAKAHVEQLKAEAEAAQAAYEEVRAFQEIKPGTPGGKGMVGGLVDIAKAIPGGQLGNLVGLADAIEGFQDAMAAPTGERLVGATPAAIEAAGNKALAKAQELANAQAEYDRADNESVREKTTLTAQLAQKTKTDLDKEKALKISGEARAAAALEKERADRNKAFDEAEAAWDKEEDAYQKKLALMEKERKKQQEINAEHKEALGDLRTEARIKGLREQGRDTQANREERALRVQQRARQIMDLGESPEAAVGLAMQLEGGRGRINARSRRHRQAGGIDEITEAGPRSRSISEERRIERHLEKMEKHLSGKRDDKGDPVPREH